MKRDEIGIALASVPLFRDLGEEWRELLAAQASPAVVRSGQWLFREGDPGDALYVVEAGRFEVVSPGERGALRTMGSGAVLGELALLTRSSRSASVRATRDSHVWRIERDAFERLCESQPDFQRRLVESLAEQLASSRGRDAEAPSRRTVALVAGHANAPVLPLAAELERRLAEVGSVARLDACDEAEAARRLDQAEGEADRVLLIAPTPPGRGPSWADFAARQADRVLAVARAGAPTPPRSEWLRGLELVAVREDTHGDSAAAWIDALSPGLVHRVGLAPHDPGLARLARRLAGRSLGVVLSAGGARAFAHVGVLAEIEAAGFTVDRVGACSMGAIVGALYAGGLRPAEIADFLRERPIEKNYFAEYRSEAGAVLARDIEQRVGTHRIEGLACDYFCVSTDLGEGELGLHRHGELAIACRASMALPAILEPAVRDGHVLVDGAVLDALPVDIMLAERDGPVFASDVTGRGARMARWVKRWLEGAESDANPMRLMDVAIQSLDIGSQRAAEEACSRALLAFRPSVPFGTLAFHELDAIIEAGRADARAVLASAPSAIRAQADAGPLA